MTYIASWKFAEFLEQENITPTQLQNTIESMGSEVSRQSLYNLRKDDVTSIRFDTLAAIIPALRRLTGKQVEVTDLLEIKAETGFGLSASGLPYTGDPDTDEILDDPKITARLMKRLDEYKKAGFELL